MRILNTLLKNTIAAVFIFTFTFGLFIRANAQDVAAGESLYKQNCASCHNIQTQLIGPALKGISQRRDEAWLLKWIKNSQAVIKSGDKYAVELYNKFNQSVMPSQNLTDDEIKNILAYVKAEESKPADAATAGADGASSSAEGESEFSTFSWIGLAVLVLVLFLVILVLNRVISTLEGLLRDKNGVVETEDEKVSREWIGKLFKNKKFVLGAVLVLLLVGGKLAWNEMNKIGIQQGYKPVQPIKFSHELHAGTYKVNCQYCHSGAYKSKNASIPSANVCMNCHNYVKPESPEIQKIYAALDWDPATRTYGTNQKPIQWVRIHNLPDFAYFNHSQHVKVGNIQCQKCHGPVEQMKEVYQYSTLTMGWCINCHRETEVNAKGNAYYDNIIAKHEAVKKGVKLTAAEMGGLECAKCHY